MRRQRRRGEERKQRKRERASEKAAGSRKKKGGGRGRGWNKCIFGRRELYVKTQDQEGRMRKERRSRRGLDAGAKDERDAESWSGASALSGERRNLWKGETRKAEDDLYRM